ncbi:flavin reductase family protein [Geobacter sp.]|uniref:flavin reductase family protein n=1 Tax=Geobacter sp. TaxID=46610 RepID=UPI0027B896AB|nr:flavin reductase family protein [Geobacter sp.]
MKVSLGAKPLALPTPAWLVGTYDADGRPNIATVAWCGVCCTEPPSIAVSLRKARHSHGAIVARKAFTVNVPSDRFVRETDYAGIVSGRAGDKFAATGLTSVPSDLVDAPFVDEFPLVIECRLAQIIEVGTHIQFIGEIVNVRADEAVLDANGLPDMLKVRPIVYDPGAKVYYGVGDAIGKAFSIGNEVKNGQE